MIIVRGKFQTTSYLPELFCIFKKATEIKTSNNNNKIPQIFLYFHDININLI